jgi:hypothetical protein
MKGNIRREKRKEIRIAAHVLPFPLLLLLCLDDATLDRAQFHALGFCVFTLALIASFCIDFGHAFSGFNRLGRTIRFAITTRST